MNLTTQLDAVNSMLALIGELPINTLTGNIPADAAIAKNTLNDAIREVQVEGWFFNTESCKTLQKDNDGYITVSSNTIRVSISPLRYRERPVLRGTRLQDTKDSTYVFTRDIVADEIVYMLDFEELPEAARQYIVKKASRAFQAKVLGSNLITQVSMKDEMDARANLMREEAESSEANLTLNPEVLKFLSR